MFKVELPKYENNCATKYCFTKQVFKLQSSKPPQSPVVLLSNLCSKFESSWSKTKKNGGSKVSKKKFPDTDQKGEIIYSETEIN